MKPGWNISKKNIRKILFLIELGQSLCTPYIQQRARLSRNSKALAIVNSFRNPDLRSTSSTRQNGAAQVTSFRLSHQPVIQKMARCHICPYHTNANNHAKRWTISERNIFVQHTSINFAKNVHINRDRVNFSRISSFFFSFFSFFLLHFSLKF